MLFIWYAPFLSTPISVFLLPVIFDTDIILNPQQNKFLFWVAKKQELEGEPGIQRATAMQLILDIMKTLSSACLQGKDDRFLFLLNQGFPCFLCEGGQSNDSRVAIHLMNSQHILRKVCKGSTFWRCARDLSRGR